MCVRQVGGILSFEITPKKLRIRGRSTLDLRQVVSKSPNTPKMGLDFSPLHKKRTRRNTKKTFVHNTTHDMSGGVRVWL